MKVQIKKIMGPSDKSDCFGNDWVDLAVSATTLCSLINNMSAGGHMRALKFTYQGLTITTCDTAELQDICEKIHRIDHEE